MGTKDEPPATATKAVAKEIAPRSTRRWRAWIFQGYLVAATVALGILIVLASFTNYFPIDLQITLAIQRINVGWFSSLMVWLSYIGYPPQVYLMVIAIIVLLFAIGLRWEAVVAALAAAGVSALGAAVKIAVHRPRPGADLVHVIQQLHDYSFPSGHVLLYTAFFGFLFFLAYTLLKPSFLRAALLIILGGLVALIGASRIYVGEHWASDVTGAYLLGSLWLVVTVYVYRWGKTRFFVRQPVAPEVPKPSASAASSSS